MAWKFLKRRTIGKRIRNAASKALELLNLHGIYRSVCEIYMDVEGFRELIPFSVALNGQALLDLVVLLFMLLASLWRLYVHVRMWWTKPPFGC